MTPVAVLWVVWCQDRMICWAGSSMVNIGDGRRLTVRAGQSYKEGAREHLCVVVGTGTYMGSG